MKSAENLLPKLVIAPAFVLGFAFIYGLMIWNGVLSLTGSRMLPNYENFVGLDQYAALWEMDRWYVALKNLGIFSVLYVGGSMAVGMVLAIFLDQKIRAEGVLRTLDRPAQADPAWARDNPDPGSSSAPYRLYNIGNHQPVELLRFIEVLEQTLGMKAQKNFLPLQAGDVPATYADVADLMRDTGFKPATSIETGIARFVEWYRAYYKV